MPILRSFTSALCASALLILALPATAAITEQPAGKEFCPRPKPGAEIREPDDLHSNRGILKVDLTIHNYMDKDGILRFCYLTPDGAQSPTLRLSPGDLLILRLKNDLIDFEPASSAAHSHRQAVTEGAIGDPCRSGSMSRVSTNLHFHGLAIPPVCHQDEVLKTAIQPGDPTFEYRFKIPMSQPPGLYWYHPHVHGYSNTQVRGGASGALVIEGIERANLSLAGLPERLLIIRDQDLINPDASPSKSEPVVPKTLIDRDGDSANNGTGFGKPAKDLSINFVPVPYPDYPPAVLKLRPDERQLWRVLNASSITYLNLAVIFKRAAQSLGIVAIDGVPLNQNGNPANAIEWRDHVGLAPGSRVEFIVTGPSAGTPALLVTRTVDTGQGGENDPNRALARIITEEGAQQEPQPVLKPAGAPILTPLLPWLGDVRPARVRRLYFSERLLDPGNPNSATEFYITVDGEAPVAFDPATATPSITVKQGDVEDWIVENRSNELHAFHIHQIHFLLMDVSGTPTEEPFLRDTVNVPYYNGRTLQYPSVRLRMDFRGPDTIGTFVYHCHLLEHEDGGMMGMIRVDAK